MAEIQKLPHPEKEHRLLAQLNQALTLMEVGRATIREVERARRELIEFYRALGMHP